MTYFFRIDCPDCEGNGVVSDREPNDPSSRDIDCYECGGTGDKPVSEDFYDSEEDLLKDYPNARNIFHLPNKGVS